MMRLEGSPLTADLEDFLPDFRLAFEGTGPEAGGFYYTSDKSIGLNERFGDLLYKIKDLEVRQNVLLCHGMRGSLKIGELIGYAKEHKG